MRRIWNMEDELTLELDANDEDAATWAALQSKDERRQLSEIVTFWLQFEADPVKTLRNSRQRLRRAENKGPLNEIKARDVQVLRK